jgi:ABC-2 type transport system permease protein
MTAVQHSSYMMVRYVRALMRQPAWIFVTLVQPVIWLLLFGALFERTVDIPGFASDSYIEFLAPGVVVMTAFFSAGWSGMGMIQDYDRGILDRFLSSPVKRVALIAGPLMQNTLVILIQSVIIVVLALIMGATFANGVMGVAALILISSIVGAGFGALSNGMALVFLKEESLIATMVFLQLPLTFLSGAFMQESLQPEWMQVVADFNPVNWAVEAGRNVAMEDLDWSLVLTRTGLLIAFLVAASVFATRVFRTYQRSI